MLTSLLARLSDDARRSLLNCTTTFSIVALLAFGMAAIPSTQASAKDHDGALGVMCGDSNGDETLSVSDALEIVRFSAGIGEECVPPACDTNSSGAVTVTDGLIVISHAVGLDVGMQCPGQRGVGGNILVTLDFEDRTRGEVIDRLTPVEGDLTIEVRGSNPNSTFPDRNAALIFDSSCKDGCSGADDDLGSPNEDFDGPGVGIGGGEGRKFPNDQGLGNIMIIAENLKDGDEDGLIDDPDDQGAGPVAIDFDFGVDPIAIAPTITLLGITYIDVEHIEMDPLLELFDDSGALVDVLSLPTTGNNGVNVFVLPDPMPGVARFRLSVRGSMGIDNIVFSLDLPPTSSTTTTMAPTTTSSTTTMVGPTTTTTLPAEGCGDGNIDPGEDCDPGTPVDDDCCTAECMFVGEGATCGDPTFRECSGVDTCDGAGTCDPNDFEAGGPCGDSTDDVCTDPDSCDGAGTCDPNDAEVGTACGSSDRDCIEDDGCDGAGMCAEGAPFAPGTACGLPLDTECTNPDTCNDIGICQDNDADDGTSCVGDPCGDAATCQEGGCICPVTTTTLPMDGCGDGNLDPGEDCDPGTPVDGDCCTAECMFEGAGAPCDDGDACIVGATCSLIGTCDTGGIPQDCSEAGDQCNDAACDPAGDEGNCDTVTPARVGDRCADGDACVIGTRCSELGECSGGHDVDCSGPGRSDQCNTASCDPTAFEGNCITKTPVADGTSCSTVPCFDAATCQAGRCTCPDTTTTTVPTGECGDGNVDPGEDCDPGTPVDDDCCTAGCMFVGVDENCGDNTNNECTGADRCDGAGTCDRNHVEAGLECGDDTGGTCTDPDTCDGAGNCAPNDAEAGLKCGQIGVCYEHNTCDGAGACVDGDLLAPGAPCGDTADTECTNPDTCNDIGICQDNDADAGAACGSTGVECVEDDACDGAGTCLVSGLADAGTACGDPESTGCTDPDTCDGAGTCEPNHANVDKLCGPPPPQGSCFEIGMCDGDGTCQEGEFSEEGSTCGDKTDTDCKGPDTCDATGTCEPNHADDGAPCTTDPCGDAATCDAGQCTCSAGGECGDGDVDPGEDCDPGAAGSGECCTQSCTFVGEGAACGDPTVTECSGADSCDGAGTCDRNHFLTDRSCGDTAFTDCTRPDRCDGAGTCDPNHVEAGTIGCGVSDRDCGEDDACDGAGTCVEGELFAPGTACGLPLDTECTAPDTCNAIGVCQRNDADAGAACGSTGVECVEDDACDGEGICVVSAPTDAGTACGDPLDNQCTDPDTCDGAGTCDPNDVDAGALCGSFGVRCVEDDTCDGAGTCVDGDFHEAGRACGSIGVICVDDDACDGAGTCVDGEVHEVGRPCRDASVTECTDADTCDGAGTCDRNHADDGTQCMTDPCGDAATCDAGQCTCSATTTTTLPTTGCTEGELCCIGLCFDNVDVFRAMCLSTYEDCLEGSVPEPECRDAAEQNCTL